MPIITPKQKVNQTKMFGDTNIEIRLIGDTYDDCSIAAKQYTEENAMTFIPLSMIIVLLKGREQWRWRYLRINRLLIMYLSR